MDQTLWWGHGFDFMWLIPIFFFVVVMLFVRGVFGRGASGCGFHGDSARHEDNAREILDKRFAKGEITKNEYEAMKKSLGYEPSNGSAESEKDF